MRLDGFKGPLDLPLHGLLNLAQKQKVYRSSISTLAIIANHQPAMRTGIETVRRVSLSQSTLDTLLEARLLETGVPREVPERPPPRGTTGALLTQVRLRSLKDLPRRADLVRDGSSPVGEAPG